MDYARPFKPYSDVEGAVEVPQSLPWEAKPRLVGSSAALQRLLQLVQRVAPTNLPLLIWGPTGAGKEVVAQLVHEHHNGGRQPFVDLNCGAIPESLIEAELFGAAKGAYTGAMTTRPGQLELAGRGTLFLDEVGELPMALQPKFLRVLETRTFRPLGSMELKRFEGRVVAATHRDLLASVKAGTFREDLYYRLAPFVLDVPSLEQRREDIPALVAHFAARQPRPLHFTPQALDRLRRHAWPGNVRQLRNLIDRLGVLAEDPLVTTEVLEPLLSPVPLGGQSTEWLADALLQLSAEDKLAAAEQLLVDRALELCQGNKTLAARMLGVGRKVVERRVLAREDKAAATARMVEQARRRVECTDFMAAMPLLEKALAVLPSLPAHDDVRRVHFDALRLMGVCKRSTEGWLSARAKECYEAALAMGNKLVDESSLISILFGIWTAQLMALDLAEARGCAQQMLQRAQASNDVSVLGDAHFAMANTLFWLGDSAEALACLVRGELVPVPKVARASVHGFDLAGLALTFEGLACFQLGQFQRARRACRELEQRTQPGGAQGFDLVIALQGVAWLACLSEDMPTVQQAAGRLEQVSRELGLPFYQGLGQLLGNYAAAVPGALEAAEASMVQGYEGLMLRNGGQLFHSFQAWKRADVLLRAGQAAQADALTIHALDVALERQERAYLSELMVLRARARQALGDVTEAESALRTALSTAMALGSVPGRIAAASHLAALLMEGGRREPAADVMSRALRGVPCDDAVPPWVAQAHALLQALKAG